MVQGVEATVSAALIPVLSRAGMPIVVPDRPRSPAPVLMVAKPPTAVAARYDDYRAPEEWRVEIPAATFPRQSRFESAYYPAPIGRGLLFDAMA